MKLYEVRNAYRNDRNRHELIGYVDEEGRQKYIDSYLQNSKYEQDGYVSGKESGFPKYKKVFVGSEVFSNKIKKKFKKQLNS